MTPPAPPAYRPKPLDLALAAGLTLTALALYTWTAAPDLTLVDSGELALAAVTASPAHPPGFPLYILLGRLFSALPFFASPVRALNLMSACLTALSVGVVYLTAERLLAAADGAGSRHPTSTACASLAAVAWMTGRNPWSWSGLTEVYALNNLLLSLAWMCVAVWISQVMPWRAAAPATRKDKRRRGARPRETIPCAWLIAAFAFATLGLANHHVTTLPLFPALLIVALLLAPRAILHRRFLVAAAIGLASLLLLYALLIPLAARMGALDWGGVHSPGKLLAHIAGRQYRNFFTLDAGASWVVARQFVQGLVMDCGPVAILAGAAALGGLSPRASSSRGAWALTAGLAALMGVNLLMNLIYVAGPEDRLAYDLPSHLALCLLASLGMRRLLGRIGRHRGALAAAALAVTLGFNLPRNYDYCNLRHERTARTLVEETLATIPEGAVLFSTEWNFYAPYLYMRHVEGYRTDLRVVDALLMRRTWYLHYLERQHPDLIEAGGIDYERFLDQLTRFNNGEPYDNVLISRSYDELMARWVELGRAGAGAFADAGCIDRPDERGWTSRSEAHAHDLLAGLMAPGAGPPQRTMGAKDAENLAYVFGKISKEGELLGPESIIPRHVQYAKAYRAYSRAVLASLRTAWAEGGEPAARELAERYRPWYPRIDSELASALRSIPPRVP